MSAEEICEASSKLITFIDLAGHQKYIKTTIFGLTAHRPDFSMLVVGANSGVGKLTSERLQERRVTVEECVLTLTSGIAPSI